MDHHAPVYPMPSEGELIAFPHGAAGHQGISSNAAGDLLIKPCTQAEIDFYEAAKDHPSFQAHMPVYVGKLERGEKAVKEALTHGTAVPAIVAAGDTEKEGAKDEAIKVEQPGLDKIELKEQAKAWTPSGGKKLSTGLAIVLENAAAAFKKPNVMDLKLGARLWDNDAPEEKRKKLDQVAAETTSGSLGFRIAGAKLWLGTAAKDADVEVNTEIKDGYKTYNKHYGRSLDEQSAHKAIARFLSGTMNPTIYGRDKAWLASQEARILTKRLIRELESIKYVLEHEESRMYSASILIVIEGDQKALLEAMAAEKKLEEEAAAREAAISTTEDTSDAAEDDEDEDEDSEDSFSGPKVMEVRLIDFAHAQFTPGQGPDENALKGISSIIEILEDISK